MVETFETKRTFPIVVHTFNGKTKTEAMGYFRAHLKTDSFLRGCTETGYYGLIPCRVSIYWK